MKYGIDLFTAFLLGVATTLIVALIVWPDVFLA